MVATPCFTYKFDILSNLLLQLDYTDTKSKRDSFQGLLFGQKVKMKGDIYIPARGTNNMREEQIDRKSHCDSKQS